MSDPTTADEATRSADATRRAGATSTTATISTSTGQIAYDEHGDGDRKTIVMLPSGAHDRHDYDELRARLSGRFRTIALDWPAHGDSPPHSAPADVTMFADAAEQAIAQLAPGGAVVIGNSIGGFSAARLAIRRPELVKALVIVDGGGFAGAPLYVRAFCALMSRPRFLRAIYPTFSARYMRVRSDADRRAREVGIATTRTAEGLAAVAGLWGSFATPAHDLRAEAHRITAPSLLIWGKRDPVIPLRVGRAIARLIPGAQLHVLDTGHVPHTSDPDGFAAVLVPFLDAALGA
jgi:pimeloyl-ACP methyl ester carboxylesterase